MAHQKIPANVKIWIWISYQNIKKKLAHQKIRAYLFNDMRVCKVERIIIPQMKRSSVRRYLIACWSCAVAAVWHIWGESQCSIWGHAAPPLLCLAISTHLQISTPYLHIYTQHYELRLGQNTTRNWHSFTPLWNIGSLFFFFFFLWNR